MLGPLIGGYATEHVGFQYSYLVYCFFSFVPILIGMFMTPIKQKRANKLKQKQSVKDLLFIPGITRSMIVSMIILAALDIFYVYYPVYASSIGMTPSEIGWILMIQSLASVFTRILLPVLVAKYGKIQVLFSFMFLGAIVYGSIPMFTTFMFIVPIAIFIGIGLGMVQPITIMITYNLSPPDRTAEVLSIRLAGNRLSQVIVPLVFAGISGLTGLGAIFMMKAVILGIGAIFARGINPDPNKEYDTEKKAIEK